MQKWKNSTALLVALLVISNLIWFSKVNSVENNLSNQILQLRREIGEISSGVSSAVDNALFTLDQQAQKQASIIESFSYELGEYKDKKVEMELRCRLKSYTEGQQLEFIIQGDGKNQQTHKAEIDDKGFFTAKMNVPLYDEIVVSIVTDVGDTKSYETINNVIIEPKLDYVPTLEIASHSAMSMYKAPGNDSQGSMVFGFGVEVRQYGGHKGKLEDIRVDIMKNGKSVHSGVLVKGSRLKYEDTEAALVTEVDAIELEKNMESFKEMPYAYAFDNVRVDVAKGDEVQVYLHTKDGMGNKYSIIAEQYIVKQDAHLDESRRDMNPFRQFEVEPAV